MHILAFQLDQFFVYALSLFSFNKSNFICLFVMNLLLLMLIVLPFLVRRVFPSKIYGKKILVIGGSSGLGLSIVKYLCRLGNKVTVTSRSSKTLETLKKSIVDSPISTMVYDSLNAGTHPEEQFDYIFYLPGIACPGYVKNQDATIFDTQINLNFLGMIRSLYRFKPSSKQNLTFVMACSTAALFPIPGYASYSPSKAAMHSFFETADSELLDEGITLKILYCCSMQTPGLLKENETKPDFTKKIEYSNIVADPDRIARYFIDNIEERNALTYDWFTYFCVVRNRCECAVDYLLFPIAVLIVFVSRIYVRYSFREYNNPKR